MDLLFYDSDRLSGPLLRGTRENVDHPVPLMSCYELPCVCELVRQLAVYRTNALTDWV